jgi:hypothetical protein
VLLLLLLLFTGMRLFGTLDGAFMSAPSTCAFAHPIPKVYDNLTITGAVGRGRPVRRHHRTRRCP